MSDEEVIRALLVLARKLGVENRLVVAIQHGIGNREEVTEEQALCLAFGVHGAVRLCCTYGKDHPGMCSWERAIVGRSACIATSYFATTPGVTVHQCQRPSGHTGEHEATGADGVRWAWGDTARDEATGELGKGCGAWEWGTDGHKAGCILRAGHEGAHRGVDADGKSIFTWPCPCYPDCTGHTVPGVPDVKGTVDWSTVQLRTDSPEIRCKSRVTHPDGAYFVCQLVKGHDGDHRHQVTGGEETTWTRYPDPDPTEPRAS